MPAAIPESTKTSLGQRLRQRQRERWPGLASVDVRFRGRFAYVDGELHTGEVLPLCRLRYAGSASLWGFAIYLASRDGYEDSILPTGPPIGAPEEALDCACGLYLADPSAWQEHPHQPAPDHARTSIGQYLACPRRLTSTMTTPSSRPLRSSSGRFVRSSVGTLGRRPAVLRPRR